MFAKRSWTRESNDASPLNKRREKYSAKKDKLIVIERWVGPHFQGHKRKNESPGDEKLASIEKVR